MKELLEVNASFEDLYGILIAPIRTKLMLAGIGIRVFNHLSESRSTDAVKGGGKRWKTKLVAMPLL